MPRKNALDSYQPPPKKPSEYQGNIIYKAENSMGTDFHFYQSQSNQLLDCTSLIHMLAAQHVRFSSDKKRRESEMLKAQEKLNEQIESFRMDYGPEILDIILNGKLRLHLLLNTETGIEYAYNEILALMNYVRSKNGLVEAYGKEKVHGLAALAFIQADVRYAITKSQFKWFLEKHDKAEAEADFKTERASKRNLYELEKKEKERITLIKHLLLENTNQEAKKEMAKLLYESFEARMDSKVFAFTGTELMNFGIITQLFTDIEALKAKFARNLSE